MVAAVNGQPHLRRLPVAGAPPQPLHLRGARAVDVDGAADRVVRPDAVTDLDHDRVEDADGPDRIQRP
ncbi:MAG TPA: hypothetical protein VKP11_12395, partial [Frankiaceae bacterium]|nr:hypothetical protein [Frankiaceae bacterium]